MKDTLFVHGAIPHYRKKIFTSLSENVDFLIFDKLDKELYECSLDIKKVRLRNFFGFMWIPIWRFFTYKNVILPLEFRFLPSLVATILLRNRVILWGQGCNPSARFRYAPYFLHILFSKRALFYCPKECDYWQRKFPRKKFISFNNAVDGLEIEAVQNIRRKHGIGEKNLLLISSYRFENPYRNDKLYFELVRRLEAHGIYFIIIGEGSLKPDFSGLKNVIELGSLYNESIKSSYFSAADLYIQLGWNGLSVVEAIKSGLPVVTLSESRTIKHSVEYQYLNPSCNAYIFQEIDEIEEFLVNQTRNGIFKRNIVMQSLDNISEEKMVDKIKLFLG